MMQSRNYTIDLLRFIASSSVVLYHLNESFDHVNNSYRNLASLGWLGVPIFFVVSGYCIGMASKHSKSSFDFLIRRFFRIFPGYWLSLLVVLGCVAIHLILFRHNSVAVLPKTLREISATILLLTNPATTIKGVNWVYWSLTVEIFFYLVIWLSLFLNQRLPFLFIIGISLLSLVRKIETIPGLFFLSDWASFGIGLALFELTISEQKYYRSLLLLIINISGLLYRHQFDVYTITALSTLILIALSVFWRDLPANRFSKLGDYAYGVYLLHVPVGVYLFGLLKSKTIQTNQWYNLAFDLVVLIVILLLARLMYIFLEMPAIRYGKKAARKLAYSAPLNPVQV